MGIRIHKIIGWGLTDVVSEHCDSTLKNDKRFNHELLVEDIWGKTEDVKGFLNWAKNNQEECKEIIRKTEGCIFGEDGRISLMDINFVIEGINNKSNNYPPVYHYDPEFGDPLVMIFTPISSKDWYRIDNIIDYYEADCISGKSKVQDLSNHCGVWPYINMIHIIGSPKYGEEGFRNHISPGEYNRLIGIFSDNMKPTLEGEVLEYYKKYYRPTISTCLILHIYWLNIFTDFYKTINELRPMIYTYWA